MARINMAAASGPEDAVDLEKVAVRFSLAMQRQLTVLAHPD